MGINPHSEDIMKITNKTIGASFTVTIGNPADLECLNFNGGNHTVGELFVYIRSIKGDYNFKFENRTEIVNMLIALNEAKLDFEAMKAFPEANLCKRYYDTFQKHLTEVDEQQIIENTFVKQGFKVYHM